MIIERDALVKGYVLRSEVNNAVLFRIWADAHEHCVHFHFSHADGQLTGLSLLPDDVDELAELLFKLKEESKYHHATG